MRLKLFGATVLSLGLLAGACANSSGDGSGDGATGSTGSTGGTGSTGSTSPPVADQVVLRIEQSGGFVAVQYNLTRMPMLSLYGDGRYVTPGPQIEIYPGPALPALAQQRLTPEAIHLLHPGRDRRRAGHGSQLHDDDGLGRTHDDVHVDDRRRDPHDRRVRARLRHGPAPRA